MNKNTNMQPTIFFALIAALCCAGAGIASAAGTPAGTIIPGQATANYTIGATSYVATSNTATVRVDELLSSTVVWMGALPGVAVSPGAVNQPVTVRVTNTGNGSETYLLSALSAGILGDQFDPALAGIALDANGNGTYEAGVDTVYTVGVTDPLVAADGSLALFVLNTIPPSAASGDQGFTRLIATSATGTGIPGATFAGAGDAGSDAVVGLWGGAQTANAAYVVGGVNVAVSKAVTVIDPRGGTRPEPGALLRYTITVTVPGSGTAAGVVITDMVPVNTTYVAGTLRLNAASLTDIADADAGDAGATTPGVVTVRLGDLTNASPVQTINFDVRIN
ncbi:MAG: hypothetical protein ACYC7L_09310 [Nitrospirota bacterium]